MKLYAVDVSVGSGGGLMIVAATERPSICDLIEMAREIIRAIPFASGTPRIHEDCIEAIGYAFAGQEAGVITHALEGDL